MIRDFKISEDDAGFPKITWTEDRNLASPEAMRRARVECRIMKEAKTGILLFVARGNVRHGSFEEGKVWERLTGFSQPTADELYYTKKQLEFRHYFASKSIGAKLALTDNAHVLRAEFAEDTALHINCADATPVDIDRLRVALTQKFILCRNELVSNICRIAYKWPIDDNRVMTYDPDRPGWGDHLKTGFLFEALGWIVAVGVVAGLAALLFWELGVFR